MEKNREANTIRLLRADEIECRAAMASEKGVSLLLYKDARVDQRILDEAFGIFGWKRSHQHIGGSLYCTVEIYNKETGEWIAKQDVGSNGEQQKEKSQASDSFKRACFNWGIGRYIVRRLSGFRRAKQTSKRKGTSITAMNISLSVPLPIIRNVRLQGLWYRTAKTRRYLKWEWELPGKQGQREPAKQRARKKKHRKLPEIPLFPLHRWTPLKKSCKGQALP